MVTRWQLAIVLLDGLLQRRKRDFGKNNNNFFSIFLRPRWKPVSEFPVPAPRHHSSSCIVKCCTKVAFFFFSSFFLRPLRKGRVLPPCPQRVCEAMRIVELWASAARKGDQKTSPDGNSLLLLHRLTSCQGEVMLSFWNRSTFSPQQRESDECPETLTVPLVSGPGN